MAQFKFDIYRKGEDNSVLDRTIEVDTEAQDSATIERVLKSVVDLKADKQLWIAPDSELAAHVLLKGKTRGSRKLEVSADIVKFIHEEYVYQETAVNTIPMKIFAKFDEVISSTIVGQIIDQERETGVAGLDDLRDAALERRAEKKRSRSGSSELHDRWVDMHVNQGLSGSEIARREGKNSATVNGVLNKRGVQQNKRGRIKEVVAEEVTQ